MTPDTNNEKDIAIEFVQKLTYDNLQIAPETDPFGLDYEWLKNPQSDFERSFDRRVNSTPASWYELCGIMLRKADLVARSVKTNEQAVTTWVTNRFPAICKKAGNEGDNIYRLITSHGDLSRGVVYEVFLFMTQQEELRMLMPNEKVALALSTISMLGPKSK